MSNFTAENTKHIVDMISMGTVVGTLLGILPAVAALFTIVWTAIRIWESHTVREWRGRKPYAE